MKNLTKKNKVIILFAFVLSFSPLISNAQAGIIDLSFFTNQCSIEEIGSVAVQPDGKILIGGRFDTINGVNMNNIARLNADGSIDTTFHIGNGLKDTITNNNINNVYVNDIKVQNDGKIIFAGCFSSYNHVYRNGIVRILPNGEIDSSFSATNSILGKQGTFNAIQIQNDGKIIVGGDIYTNHTPSSFGKARINADGSLDTTFNIDSNIFGIMNSISIQTDGKIIAGGPFNDNNTSTLKGIIRLNIDGAIDNSFNNSGFFAGNIVNTTFIQGDGRIIIGGIITSYNGTAIKGLARLNTNGTLDNSFILGNGVDTGTIDDIIVQPDGK